MPLFLALLCLAPLLCPSAHAATDREHLAAVQRRDRVDLAIEKGLAWLATQQDVTHGHFAGKHKNVYTGLACMALMASGHFPERSAYGDHLRRGVLYLAQQALKNKGYLGKDGGRMYGHGICTLALAEAYGMMSAEADNRAVKLGLESALKVILGSQATANNKHRGGWRYEPKRGDADLSATAWQILALRAAQNCCFDIPDNAINEAIDYVRRTYKDKQGFAYQPGHGANSAMRAAGVVCMQALGADKSDEDTVKVNTAAEVLLTLNPSQGKHYYYRSYYLATAANMMGDKHRTALLGKLENALVALQNQDGSFKKHSGHDGGVYSTAFAVICLAVRYQFLPIYQE